VCIAIIVILVFFNLLFVACVVEKPW